MFEKKEFSWIIITIIIFTFIIGFTSEPQSKRAEISFFLPLLASALIIITNTTVKKIAAPYYNIKIKYKMWVFQRYGVYNRAYFKKPFPIGLVLPFFVTLISLGLVKPMTLLQFDETNIPEKRLLKRRGGKRYVRKEEMNDSDPAFTAAWGFYALLLLSLIGYFIGFSELARFSLYYGAWNLLPLGKLDGGKLFFGSAFAWGFLVIIYIFLLVGILFL